MPSDIPEVRLRWPRLVGESRNTRTSVAIEDVSQVEPAVSDETVAFDADDVLGSTSGFGSTAS